MDVRTANQNEAGLFSIYRYTVKWNLAGVPKGQEETLRGALEGYYVNGYVANYRSF
jgi:hypothetical protein